MQWTSYEYQFPFELEPIFIAVNKYLLQYFQEYISTAVGNNRKLQKRCGKTFNEMTRSIMLYGWKENRRNGPDKKTYYDLQKVWEEEKNVQI